MRTGNIRYTLKLTDNRIDTEGAEKISESLKINTSLTKLNLKCELWETCNEPYTTEKSVWLYIKFNNIYLGNPDIHSEGIKYIAEAMKTNSTLIELNLESEIAKQQILFEFE